MRIAIRVDASEKLGTGHFMRCLTLADALSARGATVTFLSAHMPDLLQGVAIKAGHGVLTWPDTAWTIPEASSEWSIAGQDADADATLAHDDGGGWIVCDHYGLGRSWEQRIRGAGRRVLAIDDLGRAHDCDILLDQNFYADPSARYPGDAADNVLVGPKFALLKPAFAQARAECSLRKDLRRLHLCMGGADPKNTTAIMLDAIELAGLRALPTDIVIGALHPASGAIAARCKSNPAWTLHVQTERMADLLAAADLAIGAGGTATWERCVLGVPTLAVEIETNQTTLLAEISRAGIVYGVQGKFDAARIAKHLAALVDNPALRAQISANAFAVTDGAGATRVANLMSGEAVRIREALLANSANLHAWRNAPSVRAVSRTTAPIELEAHERWLRQTLDAPDRWLLIGSRAGHDVGVVRFDLVAPTQVEVSIYTTADAAPGDGTPLLLAAEAWLRGHVHAAETIRAVVMAGNARSGGLFARAGYTAVSEAFEKKVRP